MEGQTWACPSRTLDAPRKLLVEYVFDHDSLVVLLVPWRRTPASHRRSARRQGAGPACSGVPRALADSGVEPGPLLRVVAEPTSVARRLVRHPSTKPRSEDPPSGVRGRVPGCRVPGDPGRC